MKVRITCNVLNCEKKKKFTGVTFTFTFLYDACV